MKKLSIINYQLSILLGSWLLVLGSLSSCKEIGPTINLRDNENLVGDTTYIETPIAVAEAKNILLEEFTGVNCPNCPQAHVIIADLKNTTPNRIFSVSYHPQNSFSNQRPTSVHDLRTDEATTLLTNYFTWPGFEPIGAVNRKLFSSESNLLLDRSKWSTRVNAELNLTTPVNLVLEKIYDSVNRKLTIVVELHYTQEVAEQNKLSILLTESDIVTTQLDGSTDIEFYVHKDVHRTFVSTLEGDIISTTTEAGRVVRKVYIKNLDAAWKPENMHIIAFVHEFENSKVVYQGKEIKVVD